MTYGITKTFHWSMGHRLSGLEDGHPCGRVHGHNYAVTVAVTAVDVDGVGMVLDYGHLSSLVKPLTEYLDHRTVFHPNDATQVGGVLRVADLGNPTAENLARWFHDKILPCLPTGCTLAWVEVREGDTTSARYCR